MENGVAKNSTAMLTAMMLSMPRVNCRVRVRWKSYIQYFQSQGSLSGCFFTLNGCQPSSHRNSVVAI